MPCSSRPMPIGQVTGAVWIRSTLSISSSSSMGGRPSRSSLLMKVKIGVSRKRQTSISLMVRSSTPLAQSMTMRAESTAVSVRYVSSEKSSWPGVSSRFTMHSRYGNCITEEVTEIPRCCSRRIQSEGAWRAALRPLTAPAIWMAPPNSSSFSVRVVLPASGCEMIAKVRRRPISAARPLMGQGTSGRRGLEGAQGELEHGRILAAAERLVVAAPGAGLLEAHGEIEPHRRGVRGPHLEKGLGHAGGGRALDQGAEQALADAPAAIRLAHAEIQDMRLAR